MIVCNKIVKKIKIEPGLKKQKMSLDLDTSISLVQWIHTILKKILNTNEILKLIGLNIL